MTNGVVVLLSVLLHVFSTGLVAGLSSDGRADRALQGMSGVARSQLRTRCRFRHRQAPRAALATQPPTTPCWIAARRDEGRRLVIFRTAMKDRKMVPHVSVLLSLVLRLYVEPARLSHCGSCVQLRTERLLGVEVVDEGERHVDTAHKASVLLFDELLEIPYAQLQHVRRQRVAANDIGHAGRAPPTNTVKD